MLYIIATPIGNLEDITLRAIRMLKEVDYILAEDTRRTGKLLSHYQIKNKMVSYNDINKKRKTPFILQELQQGKNIALVSDAGTPGISDPGFYLVRACRENNLDVSCIPGPNAAITALVASGLPTDQFSFYGFIPKSPGKKKKLLQKISEREETAILYESPHRIEKTLTLINETMPQKQVVVARELTKKFEEYKRGTAKEILNQNKKIKGEITLIIK